MQQSNMNPGTAIPDDIRRFVLSRIPSVPHLEAILLMRNEAYQGWDGARLARRLYLVEGAAQPVLEHLHASGVLSRDDAGLYRFDPVDSEVAQLIDRLAVLYAHNLVGVTNLIHSETAKKARRFADAFRWRKDS